MSGVNQCYKCKYRRRLDWSAHSECMRYIQKRDFKAPKYNQHGQEHGWYNFPYNYDPVWQTSVCDGLETLEE